MCEREKFLCLGAALPTLEYSLVTWLNSQLFNAHASWAYAGIMEGGFQIGTLCKIFHCVMHTCIVLKRSARSQGRRGWLATLEGIWVCYVGVQIAAGYKLP